MKTPLKISHIDTLAIGRRYILANFKYEEFQMVESRFTDQMYYLSYLAKDVYDRDVELAVTIDMLNRTISGGVVLHCDELQSYL